MYKAAKKYLAGMLIIQIVIYILMTIAITISIKQVSLKTGTKIYEISEKRLKVQMKREVDNAIFIINDEKERIERGIENQILFFIRHISLLKLKREEDIFKEIENLYSSLKNEEKDIIIFKIIDEIKNKEKYLLLNKNREIEVRDIRYYQRIKKENLVIEIFVEKEKLNSYIKEKIFQKLNKVEYGERGYLWIREIVNYNGGDNYAESIFHMRKMCDCELSLSTNKEDINGEKPYLKELQMLKEAGEIFQIYEFEEENQKRFDKAGYSKFFPRYNWIIEIGRDYEDGLSYAKEIDKYIKYIIREISFFSTLSIFLIVTLGIFGMYKLQKKYNQNISKYIEKETKYDALTGAYTRKMAQGIFEENKKDISKLGYKNPLVIIIDIDNFKNINDSYGHHTGDIVLKEVVKTIQEIISTTDYLFRWGGDEFLLYSSDKTKEEEKDMINNILEKIRNLKLKENEKEIKVTVSMGGRYIKDPFNYLDEIKKADEALYYSKEKGRNRFSMCIKED